MNAYKIHTDQELTTLLKQDSQAAFKQVFDSWHKKLFHFSLRYLNNREEAEEAVHDTFLNFWAYRQSLDTEYPVEALLYTTCKRLCLNRMRGASRSKVAHDVLWNNYEDICNSTEEALNLADLEIFTERAILKLPKQQQLVFRMSRDEGLSQKVIAEKLQISKETVKKHSAEALKSLRIHFNNYGLLWYFMLFMYKN
ncbi:MAG: RNA polymerase sigma-70 factor [Candidatus Pedobacter colombiensis]|uniref:RNA polymerase sigma-70 factor n=1 Tax=Candidatus Pedobacter colombiensis TaxID=3121371 RepID=A0AAJ6B561_9SPHI|nr:RNA polymerase sigma-70 factor [Pedobacter sp.]WEK17850.1 MAG: RNA polymerase sigma-70 factor [Pedobacter sp.]